MNKLLCILCMALLCVSFIAADVVVPVEVSISVEFEDTTDFEIILPNGGSRHFEWDNDSVHRDVTYEHVIYTIIDEEKWCSDNSELDEYKKIVEAETKMLNTCAGITGQLNKTIDLQNKANEAVKDRDIYENMLNNCEESEEDYRKDHETCETLLVDTQNEEDSCQSQLTTALRSTGDTKSIQSDLDAAISSKNTFGFGGLLIGIGIGYMLWKKKKRQGPSEQMEAGGMPTDYVNVPEDGPRQ